ncbi:hypothetical protein M2S00_03505 [Apilactobacillus sp. TMW 2.2459]|uniref:hypothetical protein n=1 Tax=Apilactobacillus xinyiensis TaxID=2841032 RepID=UPI00200C65ED|nr:hypothetical protein [Apilactobacillus xinyiensis]MCL0312165.1 hypothetical protein [Apilactobacillus xinyiensis]
MKNHKIVLTLLTCLLAMMLININANASGYEYRKLANKSIVTTKSVKVFRGTAGNCEADNKFKYIGHIKIGSHIKVSQYFMSTGGWIVKSAKYRASGSHFYIVNTDKTHWFK